MRTSILVVVMCMVTRPSFAQLVELTTPADVDVQLKSQDDTDLLDWFGGGVLNAGTSGQFSATATVLKFRLGERDGFSLPLYLLAGATNATLGEPEANKAAAYDLLSPTGGVANIYATAFRTMWRSGKRTRLKLGATASGRIIAGKNLKDGSDLQNPAYYADVGAVFQTGLFDPDEPLEGIAWVGLRYSVAGLASSPDYFADDVTSQTIRLNVGFYLKYRVNIIIDIIWPQSNSVSDSLDGSQARFSLNYEVGPRAAK